MRYRLFVPIVLALLAPAPGSADEPSDRDEIRIPRQAPRREPAPVARQTPVVRGEAPVSAPPPPYLEIERRSLALGVGVQWGRGTLHFAGREIPVRLRAVSLGGVGVALAFAEGVVENLRDPEDLAGLYVAAEAGGALGAGGSAIRLRNERGVALSLRSREKGAHLALGAAGVRLELE